MGILDHNSVGWVARTRQPRCQTLKGAPPLLRRLAPQTRPSSSSTSNTYIDWQSGGLIRVAAGAAQGTTLSDAPGGQGARRIQARYLRFDHSYEPHVTIGLERHDASPVHLLLVDPTGMMDAAGDFGGVHEGRSVGRDRLTGHSRVPTALWGRRVGPEIDGAQ